MGPRAERWSALTVRTGDEAAEAVAEYLRTLGAAGVAIHPGQGEVRVSGYFPPGGDVRERLRSLRAFLGCLRGWGLDPGRPAVRAATVTPEDWVAAARRAFQPLKVGDRLWVVPAWERPALPEAAVVVRLNPGLAFGTGDHPTTRLCLQEIERELGPREIVLDCGTGSGVLAVAAALLGAERVRAVDHDRLAVAAARETATLNGVSGRVEVDEGDLRDWLPRQARASLAVANLDTELILALAGGFRTALSPHGRLIVSGVPAGRAAEAARALSAAGLAPCRTRLEEGWSVIVAGAPVESP